MSVPTLQAICDAIWTYPTRTLRDGVPLVPATATEEVCNAAWTETLRRLRTYAVHDSTYVRRPSAAHETTRGIPSASDTRIGNRPAEQDTRLHANNERVTL